MSFLKKSQLICNSEKIIHTHVLSPDILATHCQTTQKKFYGRERSAHTIRHMQSDRIYALNNFEK